MQTPNSNKIHGYEVLSFEGVELTQTRGDHSTFIDIGTLFVIYFQESVRFILNLNDWSYCLLRRLPVISSSRYDLKQRTYTLTAEDGFYVLKITKIPHPEALQNLETVLENCTSFSYQGEEQFNVHKDLSFRERIGEYLEEGGYHQLSTSERIKRKFAKVTDKISRPFYKGYQDNLNLTHVRNFEALKTVDARFLAKHIFPKQYVGFLKV